MVVPNSALRQVTNLSKDWSRAVIDIPVAVTEDLVEVTRLLKDVVADMAADPEWSDLLLGDPVVAGVETIDVGYVQLRLIARTLPGRQFEVAREIRLRAAGALRDAGVASPGVVNGVTEADAVSGDGPSGDGTDQGDADAADDAAEDLPRPTDEAYLAPAPQSALVGLMAEPVSRSVPIRRSTVLMVVAFLGFGALTLVYPPAPKAVTTITTTNPNGLIPGILPATTTTTPPGGDHHDHHGAGPVHHDDVAPGHHHDDGRPPVDHHDVHHGRRVPPRPRIRRPPPPSPPGPPRPPRSTAAP